MPTTIIPRCCTARAAEKWKAYRNKIYTKLIGEANPDGSWDQGFIGAVYTTAINLTILQLDRGTLPIYQR